MLDLLHNSFFQFVLLLIVISIVFIKRKRKSLAYGVIANEVLLSVKKEFKHRVEIFFKGIPVQHVRLILLRIINDGNVPIDSHDFERSLNFSFGQNTIVLSAGVLEIHPPTLLPRLLVESDHVTLEPMLLNPKDIMTIKLLLGQHDGTIAPDMRVKGINEIKNFIKNLYNARKRIERWAHIWMATFFISMIIAALAQQFPNMKFINLVAGIAVVLMFAPMIGLFFLFGAFIIEQKRFKYSIIGKD